MSMVGNRFSQTKDEGAVVDTIKNKGKMKGVANAFGGVSFAEGRAMCEDSWGKW